MPVSSATSRVNPSTTDSPSWTSITPPGVDQSSEPSRRRFCTSRIPSSLSTMPPATSHSRTPKSTLGRMHPNVQRVIDAAVSAGITIDPQEFPAGTRTAADAAAAIGVPVGAIVKSLVWLVDGAAVVALVSGDNQLDEKKLAVASGGTEVSRPNADVVRDAT